MTNLMLQNTCYLLILTFCIDRGDGRWKERDRDNLRHDIELYKRISEEIEREIDTFYEEYPEERLEGDKVDTIYYKHVANTLKRGKTKMVDEHKHTEKYNISKQVSTNDTNNLLAKKTYSYESNHNEQGIEIAKKWPKFNEILLAIGKKYDWKNDRWIKVKEKIKTSRMNVSYSRKKTEEDNMIGFHEKHNFRYRFVKLNRTKSRRSIVVAVSAIR